MRSPLKKQKIISNYWPSMIFLCEKLKIENMLLSKISLAELLRMQLFFVQVIFPLILLL